MGTGVLHGLQTRWRALILSAVSSILTRSRQTAFVELCENNDLQRLFLYSK